MMCGGFNNWSDMTPEIQSLLDSHKNDIGQKLGLTVNTLEGLQYQ